MCLTIKSINVQNRKDDKISRPSWNPKAKSNRRKIFIRILPKAIPTSDSLPSCSPCLVFPQPKTFDSIWYTILVTWHLDDFALLLSHVRNVSFLLQLLMVQPVNIQDQEKNVSNTMKSKKECLRWCKNIATPYRWDHAV